MYICIQYNIHTHSCVRAGRALRPRLDCGQIVSEAHYIIMPHKPSRKLYHISPV